LTANALLRAISRAADDATFRHTKTSGGASDTDVNELTVTPHAASPPAEVTTVTPVENARRALRKSAESAAAEAGGKLVRGESMRAVEVFTEDARGEWCEGVCRLTVGVWV
jgi:hypothetical protein